MKKRKGISLLEIVITLAILSIVGVAITNMVMLSINTTKSAKGIIDEKNFFSNAREAIEGSTSLTEIETNLKLSEVIDDDVSQNNELTYAYKKVLNKENFEIKLFKVKEKELALKLEINKVPRNQENNKNFKRSNSSEYYETINEGEDKTLICLSYLKNNITHWKYALVDTGIINIEDMIKEEIDNIQGIKDGKELIKIFFENNSSNNLKILAYSLSEHNNQNAANVNVVLENRTKYLDDTKVAPTYDLENNSYDLNFNIITRTKIEDEYIKELGEKLEYTLEIVKYNQNEGSYTFESTNKLVSGYVPAAIMNNTPVD